MYYNRENVLKEWINELDIFLNHKNCLYWDPNFNLEELNTGWFVLLVDLAEGGGGDSTVFTIMQYLGKDKLKQVNLPKDG